MSTNYYTSTESIGSSFTLQRNIITTQYDNTPFKIVIIGDSGCGKTSLLTSFIHGHLPANYEPTIFENQRAVLKDDSNGQIIALDLWDTAGQEDYSRLRRMSYSGTNLIILAYAVDQPSTLDNINYIWAPEIYECAPEAPIILVGLKSDLNNSVDSNEAFKLAKRLNAFAHLRVSAKEYYNVDELFNACVNTCITISKPASSSPNFETKSSNDYDKCCIIV